MLIIRFVALLALAALSSRAAVQLSEPLGQSSRLTSLVISEIMYHPPTRPDGRNPEFIEIFNSLPTPEDISGYRLDGNVQYVFPAGTVVPARGFLLIAGPDGGVNGAAGSYAGTLSNDEGAILLRHRTSAVFLEVNYGTSHPWPASADGAGHSLVLARPSYGQDHPKAWAASQMIGGSPGALEPVASDPADAVVINEFLAHTDLPEVDFLELYNHGINAVDLSGYVLTDNPGTNKFVILPGTTIPPRGYLSFTETQLNFALSSDGEAIYFKNSAGTRVIDAVRFAGQENGIATGRWPDGGNEFYRLQTKTPGAANAAIRVSEVVINEIMYHPMDEDDDRQFVELFNRGTAPVNLSEWRLEGGIDFTIPTNTVIAPAAFLVIARNAAKYTNLTAVIGNFGGRLAYSGERIALSKPDTAGFFITIDEVTYGDGGRWGQWSDGGGSSLERIDPRADSRRASNWADSDETAKAPWTVVTRTGRLDNGNVAADQLQMLLQGAGECLIDDVEVLNASGANMIANSTFESGNAGWTAEGTQDRSSLAIGGYNSARSYHLRAVERGDNQLNRIRTPLTSALASGTTATIRAKIRWLRGHPEILFRLRGNWLDLGAAMNVPANPGTPGAPNTRALPNAGPAIYDDAHSPILPSATQAALVTAKVSDPDGLGSVVLLYRIDPATALTGVAMLDNGTGGDLIAGDGIFSGRIPGQSAGALAAFHITATDSAGASTRLPVGTDEFLVRFGETMPAGVLPVYRIWMTQATFNTWSSRPKLNNTPLPVTFALGNHRVIQNTQALYAGSPYISGGYNTPSGNRCGYTIAFPSDAPFLGDSDLVLDWPGGHGNERTAMQEQMGYFIADRMNLPYSHRYWIRLHVNGVTDVQRGTVFEAVNQPAGDFLDAWLPEFESVDFYKIDRAFEFNDGGGLIADPQPRLENYTTTGGAKKTEKYRWTFMKRAFESANDYSNIFSLVDAVNAPSPEPYTSQTEALVDIEEWIGMLAVEHIIVNFDAYGHEIGKNMYAAKPDGGKWQLYMFDLDWLMLAAAGRRADYAASNAPLFNSEDPVMTRMYNHPPFRRAYFRAVKKAVDGPLRSEVCDPVMDAKYAALTANGITMCDGGALIAPAVVKTWFAQRRAFLVSQLNTVATTFAINGTTLNTTTNIVTLTGTAPVEVKTLRLNGVEYPVTWTSVTDWTMRVPVVRGANALNIQGADSDGNLMVGYIDSISVTSSADAPSSQGFLVINEIMANPVIPGAEFIEILNTSSNRTFDLTGWRINGIDFDFPSGKLISPNGLLVIAKDAGAFTRAYGNSVTLAGEFAGNLDNGGETLKLIDPSGQIIDVVTYDSVAPWPAAAGASLQLVDATRDNYRVANWEVAPNTPSNPGQPQWRFVSTTGTASTSRLYIYMNSAGDVHIDDLKIVAGLVPDAGVNMVQNGDFESTFPGPWTVSANLSASTTSTAVKRSGNRSLRVVSSAAGTTQGSSIWQDLTPLVANDTYTLSYWYLPSTNGAGLTIRLSGNGINHTENISPASASTALATPGAPNLVRRPLPAWPEVWINEINPSAAWIELYNAGDTAVSLNDWFLTTNYTNRTQRPFPAGTTLAPKEFKMVPFPLAQNSGSVALVFPFNGQPTVLDYANYTVPGARSLGFYPDGQPGPRENFFFPTPGAANNNAAQPLPLFINEWMAVNNGILADPADGDFDDWFELYNPNNTAIDLFDYMLADSLTNVNARWRIPAGTTMPARGFLLVWADSETGQNQPGAADLHANFRLSQDGESIALFAPNGTLIDAVTFATQQPNITQGRSPDGSATITTLPTASPARLNTATASDPITIKPPRITGAGFELKWTAQSGARYQVLFKNDLTDPAWAAGPIINATAPEGSVNLPVDQSRRFYRIERLN